jgi:hypothetical protein
MKLLPTLSILVLALVPGRVLVACSCVTLPGGAKPAATVLLNNNDAVFLGTVVGIGDLPLPLNVTHTYVANRLVLVRVTKSWKDVTDSHVIIATGVGGGDCGFPFEKGKEYVIFARRTEAYIPAQLTTSICSETQLASGASGLVSDLGPPQFSFATAAWH